MPIEIRELVIRAIVDPREAPPPPVDREELVAACVEATLRILRQLAER